MPVQTIESNVVELEPGRRSVRVLEFESKLKAKIVGQDEAATELVNVYQAILAGLTSPGRPIANMLFLGPTGSGKTRLVEAAAEILFGSTNAVIKVDCAEFQHSHEIARLIGSPPGYLGHRETPPTLTQEALDRFHTETLKVSFVLFDEIEKASDALWQLLLGVLDRATLTLGDNRKVDFSRVLIFMTSNLGATEMGRLMSGGIGFAPPVQDAQSEWVAQKIHRVAMEAARRRFSPEFMNRLDKICVFRNLTSSDMQQILEIELIAIQDRILATQFDRPFVLQCTPPAKEFLLTQGTDPKYGARPLKRVLERHLVLPISSLVATDQVSAGDTITADLSASGDYLIFRKIHSPRRNAALTH
jgi:ATP-dependent Clp protease ATP-binding subunit ClpB